ncbi:MAG: PopZ family protein [Rickettsia endosymbiont of Ixodes persulcatus]|nr:PopZ family protein [Rickettsia endosymbiont of Ixodes persulcatus]MCZ6909088.1 PopZ family protein [Rickettsia endosymbiont of Ixodes persulcatus]MCZ6909767.1 PopZ family protein [Rickettsia endosymbiont of Ixodes persulcatus]MCZ6913553.1 PopZ family protein [Rickettsia endosymbiont of Ixodes persulcatus]MCZ6920250.1 PopZ family protein [Rickettsia endosymbiont of Ixodes persulcatus]
MSTESKKNQDMSIEDILKSIKGVINERKNPIHENDSEDEDILELTEIVNQDEEEKLISTKSAEAIGNIFKNFTDTIKDKKRDNNIPSKNALEELVVEMLKPELKLWLDKNLPLLVKELVEIEIKKLAQNSKR